MKSAGKTAHNLVAMAIFIFLILACEGSAHGQAGTWMDDGSMNVAREGATATLLNDGRLLVAGGARFPFFPLDKSAELYGPTTGTWTFTGNMNVAREGHTATLLNDGRVLVTGGVFPTTVELYDPAIGTWTFTRNMNVARAAYTQTLLNDGRVLVAGGFGTSASDETSAELYDPAIGTWTPTGSMSSRRAGHTATLLSDGRVLIAGGERVIGTTTAAELYDPATGTWSTTGSMVALSRSGHTATRLTDGRVLVAGGFLGNVFSTAEIYDPTTGTWTPTGNMNVAREAHIAVSLPSGRILVVGGDNPPLCSGPIGIDVPTLNSTEEYDPVTGSWRSSTFMRVGRVLHTATLLTNGTVLVEGGVASSVLDLDSMALRAAQHSARVHKLNCTRLHHRSALKGLDDCFPLKVLSLEAPAASTAHIRGANTRLVYLADPVTSVVQWKTFFPFSTEIDSTRRVF